MIEKGFRKSTRLRKDTNKTIRARFVELLRPLSPFYYAVVGVFLCSAIVELIVYIDMPIVRNSLLYGQIQYALLDFGADFSVKEHAFNKALGFPVLSLLPTAIFGANTGLKIASFCWTALWVISCLFFYYRLCRVFSWGDPHRPQVGLYFTIFLFNPLVFYQFLSAYPDSLNALTFLWALYFLDKMFSDEGRWFDSIIFALVTLLAIWIKHHGFVILAFLIIFGVCRIGTVRSQWRSSRKRLIFTIIALAAMFAVIYLALSGHIPMFNLSKNKSNYSGGFEHLPAVFLQNIFNFNYYLLLSFSILAVFLLRWKSFLKFKEWYIALVVFIITIIVYKGAMYNIRYFLPAAPLFAWIICSNLQGINYKIRRLLVGVFLIINLFLTAFYNNIGFNEWFSQFDLLDRHDNLRLVDEQLRVKKAIDSINQHTSDACSVLFFVGSYYGTGEWYVWERDGLFSNQLDILYGSKLNWKSISRFARKYKLKEALLYTGMRVSTEKKHAGIRAITELSPRAYHIEFK